MMREVVMPLIPNVEDAREALKPVVDYVQAVKNHVPIAVVVEAVRAQKALG